MCAWSCEDPSDGENGSRLNGDMSKGGVFAVFLWLTGRHFASSGFVGFLLFKDRGAFFLTQKTMCPFNCHEPRTQRGLV